MTTSSMPLMTAALVLACAASPARGQPEPPPAGEVVTVSTQVVPGWLVEMIVDAKSTTTRVRRADSSFERISLSLADCGRLADAMEEAAEAVEQRKPFVNRAIGDLTVLVGPVQVLDLVAGRFEKRMTTGVTLHSPAKPPFAPQPTDFDYQPLQAVEFAKGMRLAPRIAARLKAAIDVDALRKAN